jgi:hypothetical protein
VDTPTPRTEAATFRVADVDDLSPTDNVVTDGTYSAALAAVRTRRDVQIVREEELAVP